MLVAQRPRPASRGFITFRPRIATALGNCAKRRRKRSSGCCRRSARRCTGSTNRQDAWRQRRQALWQRVIEPVVVVWANQPVILKVRVPAQLAEASCELIASFLTAARRMAGELRRRSRQQARRAAKSKVSRYVTRRFVGPGANPAWLSSALSAHRRSRSRLLICSAPRLRRTRPPKHSKRWGLFCPLYALHSEHELGRR